DVVRDLHQRRGKSRERTAHEDDRVVRGERREQVRSLYEGQAREGGDLRCTPLPEPVGSVESGPDSRATDRELVQTGKGGLDPTDVRLELRRVPGELLTERQRDRVLQVRTSDLHDVGERARFRIEGVAEAVNARQQPFDDQGR